MKKRILAILACVLMLINVFAFCACDTSNKIAEYNAVILNDAQQYVNKEFLKENVTRIPGEVNDSNPSDIKLLVKTQSEFDEIFAQFPLSVNFEEEMLAIYIFTDIYAGFDCEIKDIEICKNVLNITLLHDMAKPDASGLTPPSTSSPTLRYFVIRMKYLDLDTTNITISYKYDN